MCIFIEEPSLRDKRHVFQDRREAGRLLAGKLIQYRGTDSLVMAVPAGGVPVAAEVALGLDLPADLVIARKLQIPDNPEVGLGAMEPDGELILNEKLVLQLGLREDEIVEQKRKTREVIRQREEVLRGGRPYPDMKDKTVILVDDGLASGYTVMAAFGFVRKHEPKRVVVAVPTGSNWTVDALMHMVEELVCLNVRSGHYFAVADAYVEWYDLVDDEVMAILGRKPFVSSRPNTPDPQ